MIQIRNLPDHIHKKLNARAALAGLSLSDFLLNEIRGLAARPSVDELRARLAARSAVHTEEPSVDALRAERESR